MMVFPPTQSSEHIITINQNLAQFLKLIEKLKIINKGPIIHILNITYKNNTTPITNHHHNTLIKDFRYMFMSITF